MGMSRPAVESTLFRARRRLTEEYDDIVSGARCLRIQADHRHRGRVAAGRARHAPPRPPPLALPAAAAARRSPPGWTAACFTRPSVRERVAQGRRPPAVPGVRCKFRRGAPTRPLPPSPQPGRWSSHLPMLSDQLSSGWGKAAAGAAVLVAGVGGGGGRAPGHAAPATPAPPRTRQPAEARRRRHARPSAGVTPRRRDAPRARRRRHAKREQAASASRGRSRDPRFGGRAHRPPPTVPRRPAAVRCSDRHRFESRPRPRPSASPRRRRRRPRRPSRPRSSAPARPFRRRRRPTSSP